MIYIKTYTVDDRFAENQNVEFISTKLMGKEVRMAVAAGQGVVTTLEECYTNALYGKTQPKREIDSDATSEVLLEPLSPTLVKKYQGIDVHEAHGITIALYSPQKLSYFWWDGTSWIATQAPIFQSIALVNEGLPSWGGFLQLRLKLDKTARWQCLDVGYEVNIDLTDWLLRFGLRNYLSEAIAFSYVTQCNDGSSIKPPPYVRLQDMQNVQVQPFGDICHPAATDLGCNRITLDTEIEAADCQVHYKLTPKIDYIYGEHFVSETPCVTVRSLGESNRRHPVWEYPVGENLNQLTYIYDLDFEIVVISDDIAMARTIGHHYYSKIRHNARLHAYPWDISLSVNVLSDGMRENNLPEVEGNIPSITILGRIYNIPVLTSSPPCALLNEGDS